MPFFVHNNQFAGKSLQSVVLCQIPRGLRRLLKLAVIQFRIEAILL